MNPVTEIKPFSLVVAIDTNNGIAKNGAISWNIVQDRKFFSRLTSNVKDNTKRNAVIMGRVTWDSLPMKPLPRRLNVIISKTMTSDLNAKIYSDFKEALITTSNDSKIENIFVIGGQQIYDMAIRMNECRHLYVTLVHKNYDCDQFFPKINEEIWRLGNTTSFKHMKEDTYVSWRLYFRNIDEPSHILSNNLIETIKDLRCVNPDEQQYLDLVKEIIETGKKRGDRTGTGTLSLFGRMMRFNLRDDIFPLLTTKEVHIKSVVEELLWFIKGDTNSKHLEEKKVNIWKGNSSRAYLDSIGLKDNKEGDCGEIYGFQWRHFGANYRGCDVDYKGEGFDQLQDCINQIKNNPTSRRIFMSGWNPTKLKNMCLPPCHVSYQFYVDMDKRELSCFLYIRSNDMALGAPFNIASSSLLTYMIAHICGLKTGELVYGIGDAHVYSNHVEPLKTQLTRTPTKFPTIKFARTVRDIDDFKYEDIIIENYQHQGKIKMVMAV
jgi:dihydrofolate reductase/thymidylate synthase